MSGISLTVQNPDVIDPKEEVLREFDKAQRVVEEALRGTLNTIAVARGKIRNGELSGRADLHWMMRLAKDIQRYVELIP